jgi:hypothetical protein
VVESRPQIDKVIVAGCDQVIVTGCDQIAVRIGFGEAMQSAQISHLHSLRKELDQTVSLRVEKSMNVHILLQMNHGEQTWIGLPRTRGIKSMNVRVQFGTGSAKRGCLWNTKGSCAMLLRTEQQKMSHPHLFLHCQNPDVHSGYTGAWPVNIPIFRHFVRPTVQIPTIA